MPTLPYHISDRYSYPPPPLYTWRLASPRVVGQAARATDAVGEADRYCMDVPCGNFRLDFSQRSLRTVDISPLGILLYDATVFVLCAPSCFHWCRRSVCLRNHGLRAPLRIGCKWTPLTLRLLVSRSALCLRANIVLLCNSDSWLFLSQLLMMEFKPCRSSGCLGPPVLAHRRCLRHLKCLTRREGLWSPLSFRALP